MWKLMVAGKEWLYEGPQAIKRATAAGKLLMRRYDVHVAYVMPYGGTEGEAIVLEW
jgi:hypothetical protein